MNNNSRLLIDESPLQVLPSLAILLGLNESMILQQIHYWLNNKDKRAVPYIKENLSWVYNTHKDWHEQFPFWSVSTIRRAIQNLEDQGVLITRQFDLQEGDNKKYYTINYANLNARIADPSVQIEQTPPVQIEHTHLLKLNTPPVQIEHLYNKEAETTTENTTERASLSSEASPLAVYEEVFGKGIPIFQQEALENANVTDLTLWREVVTGWRTNGYSQRNLTGMINLYSERESRREKGTDYETKRKQAAEYSHRLITNPIVIPSPQRENVNGREGVWQGNPADRPDQFIKPRTIIDVLEDARRARNGKSSNGVV